MVEFYEAQKLTTPLGLSRFLRQPTSTTTTTTKKKKKKKLPSLIIEIGHRWPPTAAAAVDQWPPPGVGLIEIKCAGQQIIPV